MQGARGSCSLLLVFAVTVCDGLCCKGGFCRLSLNAAELPAAAHCEMMASRAGFVSLSAARVENAAGAEHAWWHSLSPSVWQGKDQPCRLSAGNAGSS